MKLTCEAIQKLANVANIDVQENERLLVAQELGKIIDWVEKLKEVDTHDVHLQHAGCQEENIFASNEAMSPLAVQKVFLNTRYHDGAYFQIPPVSTGSTLTLKPSQKG